MIRSQPPPKSAGFTLIEVLVAMFVIAIGIGALLNTLSASAKSLGHLRNKSFAEWVALNRISEVRLERTPPATGVTTGDVEFAGTKWRWRQEVIDQDMAGMLRIDVAVALADTAPATEPAAKPATNTDSESDADDFPAITKAYGYLGTDVAPANGLVPAWSLPPRMVAPP